MLGQLLGDYAVRSELAGKHPELIRGVKAHRELDAFTDAHPAFIEGCKLLESGCSRYAPVVMDVVIDRMLVKNWQMIRPGQGEFEVFLGHMYGTLRRFETILPDRMRAPANRMHSMDWFSGFDDSDEFYRVFYYMARRVRYPEFIKAAPQTIEKSFFELENLSLDLLKEADLFKFSSGGFQFNVEV